MSHRWPNTRHWQRVVETFWMTNGPRWRTAAAIVLGCEKSALRRTVDRVLPNYEIMALNAKMVAHLQRYAAHLHRRTDHFRDHAHSVMLSTRELEFSNNNSDLDFRFFPQSFTDLNMVVDESAPPTPSQVAIREMLEDA